MSHWMQLTMQDPSSPVMTMLTSFHDLMLMTMSLVLSIITYTIMFIILNKYTNQKLKEAHKLELAWTLAPGLTLLLLALPSLRLLYLMDELDNPTMTIKVIGHQWYWSYEYSDFQHIKFDSFMVPEKSLNIGEFRLLEVNNRMVVPMQTEIRLLITASDVIHSWTVPSLGIKVDAIPGRLNQSSLTMTRAGIFYGQCSEICGTNHSFMPIAVESINTNSFINWSKHM